ncbi:hypothetical protein TSAR_016466 [Trichomalopsis sarcophagae]|uniref:Armadillo repeat-containing protein 8 n=1 Tax=Trichomalopsis sarcophagae TaxID=543379 RepID=A0A232EQT1_9HYME|nr:hypothetical protein TSAR_016466 [Trichomalopsis sarcophagae]
MTSDDPDGKSVLTNLGQLMGRDKNTLIQLDEYPQALTATDSRVVYRALPCLIQLCHKDRPTREKVAAAETLACLTEVDTDLQRLASISNHLIPTLAEFLKPNPQNINQILSQSDFRTFASLGANDEDIRKRIIETENLMEQVVSGLQDPGAVRCPHSLSRSVQQLRTTFQDHAVWRPLMQLLHGADKGSDATMTSDDPDGKSVLTNLGQLMGRDKNTLIQLDEYPQALTATDSRVVYRALPCLIQLCHKDRPTREKVAAAETLACLTEVDTDLQRLASISNHLIPTLAEFLKPNPQNINQILSQSDFRTFASLGANDEDIRKRIIETENLMEQVVSGLQDPGGAKVRLAAVRCLHSLSRSVQQLRTTFQDHAVWRPLMQLLHGADKGSDDFRTFASLGANDEDIRKRIIETENLMEQVVSGLQDPGAVRCPHSLSRSVQQLRTTFQDHAVWRPLMQLLHGADKGSDGKNDEEDDLLTVASGTLCNLLLEFSPSKEPILESGGVELLCSLTKRSDPALRLNGIWALMNVAFQAEQRVKSQILTCLGTDQIFRLLADPELAVLMKTLGLLRNLLSTKTHIDRIMADHAAHVMQAVILVLEDPVHPADVKEQALCILANVADGDRARDHIMANEDVLKKLMDYMMHSNVKLQVAAIFCVCNLVWREEAGAAQRQARLKELGLYRILLQLRHTKDTQLFDKVKTALAQFFDA